ncbi:MAG: PIN domain-containing protein [Actinobacteria bacterium]|nr:PIN domain-containing protein [Actinomycetota bacterium]
MTSDGLLDTSVLVGLETARVASSALPERAAISTMTIAELHLGVLVATDPGIRARRLRTLTFAEQAYEPVAVTAEVARRFAELASTLRVERRRFPIIDTLIAATALAHDLPLFTQDADFAVFAEVDLRLLSSQ